MKVAIILIALVGSVVGIGQSQTFPNTQMLTANGKEVAVYLGFDEPRKRLTVKLHKKTPFTSVPGNTVADVPYSAIEKLFYGQAMRHRAKGGAGAMGVGCIDNPALLITCPASIGVGAMAMLTKGKEHWFYVEYRQEASTKNLTPRLSKSEYKQVLKTAKEQTGKDVQALTLPAQR